MSIKEDLDIFLITYNRSADLKKTFLQLYSEESPIRDFHITILDNASTDDTQEICMRYCQRYPNTKYIRHNRNIGAVGNIIKAMELADKKWLWILADDDNYNWNAWPKIENALNQDYDIVNTCWHDGAKSSEIPVLFNELGFVTTGIYATKNITDYVMQNAYYVSTTLNPHNAIALNVINNNGKIYAPEQKLVIENMNKNWEYSNLKKDYFHPDIKNHNVIYAWLKMYELILDKNLRENCNEVLCLGQTFEFSMNFMLNLGLSKRRLLDVYFMLNNRQRYVLSKVLLIRWFRKSFDLIVKYSQVIFSLTNEYNHKRLIILGIKFKFKKQLASK